MSQTTPPTKRIVAKSTAEYRAIPIIETEEGVTVIVGETRYDLDDLAEAKRVIDGIYFLAACRASYGGTRQ